MNPKLFIFIITLIASGAKIIVPKKMAFEVIEYANGNVYKKTVETVDTMGLGGRKIDLYFIRQHFYLPYYLPKKFVDKRYKNETITEWTNKGDTSFKTNSKNTYTYDRLSRVTDYASSPCVVCSYMAYSYAVAYNKSGWVETITGTINLQEKFKIYYDQNGDVARVDHLLFEKLETQIIREK